MYQTLPSGKYIRLLVLVPPLSSIEPEPGLGIDHHQPISRESAGHSAQLFLYTPEEAVSRECIAISYIGAIRLHLGSY